MLDIIVEEKLTERAEAMGARIKGRLASFARRNDGVAIAGLRGPGAMIGFDIVKDRSSDEPDPEATRRVTAAALDNGLILLFCGIYANVICILVPLTASDTVLDEGLDKLEAALIAARF